MPYLGEDTDQLLQTPPFIDPILARRMAQNQGVNPGIGADPGPVAPPDAASTGVNPPAGPPAGSGTNPDLQAYRESSARLAAAKAAIPPTPKPKWWQRLGAAALGGVAGYANQEGHRMPQIDPSKGEQAILNGIGYGQKMAEYNRGVQQAQAGVDETTTNLQAGKVAGETEEQQARAGFYRGENQRALDVARTQAGQRQGTADMAARERTTTQLLKGRESIGYQQTGQPIPAGFEAIPDLTTIDPKTGLPQYVHIVTPSTVQLSPDHMNALGSFLKGRKTGDVIPYSEWSAAQKAANQYSLEQMKEKGKPPTAESQKMIQQSTIAKLHAEGLLQPGDINDSSKLLNAANRSKTLSSQEKDDLYGYMGINPNTATTGAQIGIRMEGLADSRMVPVYDNNGGTIGYRTVKDIKEENKTHPDDNRYAPAGEATKSLQKGAIFGGMHYSIGNAKKAVANISSWDAGTRAQLANALRETDPKAGLAKFIQGQIGQSMTPEQKNLVISLRGLAEDMMTLRSAASMGQGSDSMRQAILDTLPNAFSGDREFAEAQLDYVEGLVQRLEKSYPGLGKGNRQTAPAGGSAPKTADDFLKMYPPPTRQ